MKVAFTDFLARDMEFLEKSYDGKLENHSFRYTKSFDNEIFKLKMPMPPWKPQYPNPADSQGVKK